MSAVADRVQQALQPVVVAHGYDLEDVDVQPAGRRRLLRVFVAKDNGIDLDDVAALSREISAALDASAAMGDQPYVLEVSSPGVDRPLTQPRHWRRNRDRLVEVVDDAGGTIIGRVGEVDDTGVVLTVEGKSTHLAFAAICRAVVQVEFSRPSDDSSPEVSNGH